jgi:DNA-binding Lrp family transcriptional regulator
MRINDIQIRLINGWQSGFPLQPEPYAEIAHGLGVSELGVLGMLNELSRAGILSRVGAVVAPNAAGASTLAAIAAPPERLEEVAAVVSDEAGVNHNYEREHTYNLWFVVTGRDRQALDKAIARIGNKTGLDVLDLPLRTAYHIDLGFPLDCACELPRHARKEVRKNAADVNAALCAEDRALLQAIERGLPVASRPYASIAQRLHSSEADVIARLDRLIGNGIIRRFGFVVRHRELGYTANAMVVWDIGDDYVDGTGESLARFPFVTLCYRRDRQLPDWPYNLFCMIHGRERATVLRQIEKLHTHIVARAPRPAVLFSTRRFKQCGARLSAA